MAKVPTFWKVTQPLIKAKASEEVQILNTGSSHDAKAKLARMDAVKSGCSITSAGDLVVSCLGLVLTEMLEGKSPIKNQKCSSKSKNKSVFTCPRARSIRLKSCLKVWLRSFHCGRQSVSQPQRDSGFFCRRAPSISVKDYVNLCLRCFCCSNECYVLALVYIMRIIKAHPDITVCSLSAHRLLFFALLLATKFHDEDCYSNAFYAKIGGLPIEEMLRLEVKFLKMLDFNAYVGPQEYQFYQDMMLQNYEHEGLSQTVQVDVPEFHYCDFRR